MDAKRHCRHERIEGAVRAHVMPLVAALAAGILLALAESPATAQSQDAQAATPATTAVIGAPVATGASRAVVTVDGSAAPGQDVDPIPAVMAPGDYEWYPERSLAGDVLIVVSLPQQQLHVYRGGVRIGRSTISSGRAGHDTPTGVFTILQKKKMHRSTLYDDAPMPFMQRLTWDGIALHAGRLPGYPASHGCVRLPAAFAEALYDVTEHGGVVVVADDGAGFPDDVVRPSDSVSADLMALATQAAEEKAREKRALASDEVSGARAAQGTGSAAAM